MIQMTVIGVRSKSRVILVLINWYDRGIDLIFIFKNRISWLSLRRIDFLCCRINRSMIGNNKEGCWLYRKKLIRGVKYWRWRRNRGSKYWGRRTRLIIWLIINGWISVKKRLITGWGMRGWNCLRERLSSLNWPFLN